jgi:hypothetical protein
MTGDGVSVNPVTLADPELPDIWHTWKPETLVTFCGLSIAPMEPVPTAWSRAGDRACPLCVVEMPAQKPWWRFWDRR